MKVVISGGTGFIGEALVRALVADGHEAIVLSRAPDRVKRPVEGAHYARWDGREIGPCKRHIEGARAVVNLAGEPVVEGRWTARKMALIRASRLESTNALVAGIAEATDKPAVLLNSSAVGYYGPLGPERITEAAPPGQGFLAEVCKDWEAAASRASAHGVRVVLLRTGIVLGRDGGALAKMLPIFRMGMGGSLGAGRHGFPWIHLDDHVELMRWAIDHPDLSGPLNATAPEPVSQREFAQTLADVLHRPALLSTPPFLLRAALGKAADAMLSGAFVSPHQALALGFQFRFTDLRPALMAILDSDGSP